MKKLKHLAEAHFFGNKQLTQREYNQLIDSEYGHRINSSNVKSMFNTLYENLTLDPIEDTKPLRNPYAFTAINTEKTVIRELIDELEDYFDVDLTGSMFNKYKHVKIDVAKDLINDYITSNYMNKTTEAYIKNALEKDTFPEIIAYLLYGTI